MHNIILTDVDEVVFRWQEPFEKWLLQTGRYQPTKPLSQYWDVEQWLGIDYEVGRELIQEFNHLEEYWSNFKPLPRVTENISLLSDLGYKFVAITACSTDKWTYDGRLHNLEKCFGDAFDTLHCVGLGKSKSNFLERYRPTYWVEDKFSHAVAGADAGHTSVLIDYPYNSHYSDPRVNRVKNWDDIYKRIHQASILEAALS